MSNYQLTEQNFVYLIEGNERTVIQINPPNEHPLYLTYLRWLEGGGIPLPAESFNLVPEEVTRAQGKAALVIMNQWDNVEEYVNSIEDPNVAKLAKIALYDTLTWHRNSEFLIEVIQALNLSTEQVDQLFITAASIHL